MLSFPPPQSCLTVIKILLLPAFYDPIKSFEKASHTSAPSLSSPFRLPFQISPKFSFPLVLSLTSSANPFIQGQPPCCFLVPIGSRYNVDILVKPRCRGVKLSTSGILMFEGFLETDFSFQSSSPAFLNHLDFVFHILDIPRVWKDFIFRNLIRNLFASCWGIQTICIQGKLCQDFKRGKWRIEPNNATN